MGHTACGWNFGAKGAQVYSLMGDALAVAMLGTGPASSRMCKRVECRKLASAGAPPAMEAWLASTDDEDGGHSAGYAH